MFACHQQLEGEILHLTLEGKLNALTAPQLREELTSFSESQPMRILLDLSDLALIDSSGVGAIVSIVKRSNASGGASAFVGLQGQPQQIFKLLNLDRAFALHDTKEEAIASLKS